MKKIILVAFAVIFTMSVFAQRTSYDVIAKVPFDARKMQYGKIDPVNMKIVRVGNEAVYIGPDKYTVKSVERDYKDSVMEYKEYDAVNEKGQEYTIKVAYDGTATPEVMRHFVLIFNDNDIYNWTYYYTSAGKESSEGVSK
ncbi:hypothetical protein NG821_10425 [Prevotella cerevisiae]|jgi:hypothetical protein|uniref:DUF4468 domain-containing protein n=1 Tax=Segatella cerevisiae TaxID=2053716 RepID=A0ABT1BYT4_9BACT|nr:hypothetical protein [Segatella cerevisiae]MCH3993525.1 hypothetical protein [Prevotella sp.]MCO6026249.1 hypothetical protein [Segatella cerevisiae]